MQSQRPEDQKNLLAAILLSVAVLLGWQIFYAGPKMKEEQERQRRLQAEQQARNAAAKPGQPAQPGQPVAAPTSASAPVAPGAPTAVPGGAAMDRAAALAQSRRVKFETPLLTGSINLTGARIDDVVLSSYRETVSPTSPHVVLFSPTASADGYFAEHGFVAGAGTTQKLPTPDTVWQVEGQGTLTPKTPVKLVWNNGEGLTFRRTISVDDAYMFAVTDEVENASGKPITLYPYGRIRREHAPKVAGFFIQHEGLIGILDKGAIAEITYADAAKKGGGKSVEGVTGGWLGFTDKYWASALIPDQTKVFRANLVAPTKKVDGASYDSFQADYMLAPVEVQSGAKASVEGRLFVGAKKVDIVRGYEARYNILKFNWLIDWGTFHFFTKPLYDLIHWLYQLLGNFGLAILAVTVIVKAAFFWFANKSYESMAKMKKVQPEMERLRERFKDDKMRQQQELMELYKKEKINPLAGCLPILIQIPVFFALYKIIFISIDMRHAPFYGWIKDLSAPDPTTVFNLFGLIPWSPPHFLMLGAWPLIMGVTMWLQMQLNPKQPDPVQQQVFNWMPVMFTFLLASFPAGLVIYWTWNNILSVAQQYFIMKRQGVDVPLMDNVRQTFGALASGIGGLAGSLKKKG
ncbi:MAG: membrane protein insertase YidC [Hyphomicrobiaceae bacterium]